MKRAFLLILAVFSAIAGIFFAKKLPADTTNLIEKKYDSWSGVIRIWVCKDLNAAGWLNACAAEIEKKYDGIYINVQEVSLDAINTYTNSGINPPDIMIYPAGSLNDTSLLSPMTAAYPLRTGLRQEAYAVPVLINPRFWIYDSSVYDALPGDMYDVNTGCREEDLTALVALCTGLRAEQGETTVLPGLDLGLTGIPEATAEPAGNTACRISPDLIIDDSPRQLFLDGEIDAFVGSISDMLRLAEHPSRAAAVTGDYAYAADITMCSIVEKDDGRGSICRAYLDVLMSRGQALAARAQAFPAVSGVSAWSGDYSIATLEAALEGKTWLSAAEDPASVYLYIEGKISADEAVRRIIGGE